jgi:hypothetical protein
MFKTEKCSKWKNVQIEKLIKVEKMFKKWEK